MKSPRWNISHVAALNAPSSKSNKAGVPNCQKNAKVTNGNSKASPLVNQWRKRWDCIMFLVCANRVWCGVVVGE